MIMFFIFPEILPPDYVAALCVIAAVTMVWKEETERHFQVHKMNIARNVTAR